MLKTKYTIYIIDNNVYFFDNKNNELYEQKFNYLKKDEILDEQKFYFELNQFIRKNKINISLFGDRVKFIISDHLSELQKSKYKEILEEYFKKVEFIKLSSLLSLNNNSLIINITEDYLDFYYKKDEKQYIRVEKILFNNNNFKMILHITKNIFVPKKIILFGFYKEIPNLTEKINKELGINCIYQENYIEYIIKKEKENKN